MNSVRRRIARLQTEYFSERLPARRWRKAKHSARRRNIPWKISYTHYVKLVNKPCHFCQTQKHEDGIGLDRIDNAKGYISGNVNPCCYLCNIMRGNLPIQLFLELVKKIRKDI